MVNRFNWCGFQQALKRKNKVLEVCNAKGWKLLCMLPGKRYVINTMEREYYWTYKEVMIHGGVLKDGNSSLDNLQISGNNLLVGRAGNKISVVRRTGSI